MPKKHRFVPFDWTATIDSEPVTSPWKTPLATAKGEKSNPPVAATAQGDLPTLSVVHTVSKQVSNGQHSLSYSHTSCLATLPPASKPALVNVPQFRDRDSKDLERAIPEALTPPAHGQPDQNRDASQSAPVCSVSTVGIRLLPPTSLLSLSEASCLVRCTSARTLRPRPAHMDRMWPRKPIQEAPLPGKIYFLPDGRYFPDSIIHSQKDQEGFFRHPVMVFEVERDIVTFYGMTKEPPRAIKDLNMAMRIGTSTTDEGSAVLRLAPGSNIMQQETWINLEQRFHIEWKNLDDWAVDVQVDQHDFEKIARRVIELEANQNRYIYKPLLRAMHTMLPGMIIMLPNAPDAATFGAPILIIDIQYPDFRFLRVKRFEDNINFNPNAKRRKGSSRHTSLAISKHPWPGHDGTPVMILEANSPDMREESYVEVLRRPQFGRLDKCKTWCWPPVSISHTSMVTLDRYMAGVAAEYEANQRVPQPAQWHLHNAMQQPGYHMDPLMMMMPMHSPGNYMYGSSHVVRQHRGYRSGHGP